MRGLMGIVVATVALGSLTGCVAYVPVAPAPAYAPAPVYAPAPAYGPAYYRPAPYVYRYGPWGPPRFR